MKDLSSLPISVVLTTYKRATFVGKTIDSILNQTFRDFELIICDDCSPDLTEEACHKYVQDDSRVIYYRNKENVGMPENLNAGIRIAQGKYIANLHDGDIYHPALLEKWKKALDEASGAAFVFNQYRIVDGAGSEVKLHREHLPRKFPGSLLIREYFRRWRFDSPVYGTVMARRSAYVDMGLFDPRFKFIADIDMWLRLADRYDVAYVPEPLIDIPNRDILPSNWNGWHLTPDYKMVGQIMWEARLRHYRERPIEKIFEIVKHGCFSLAVHGWNFIIKVKHGLRSSSPRQA